MNNRGKVKIVCMGLTGNSQAHECVLRVYTKEIIDSIYEKVIRKAWRECMYCRKRRIMIKNNEIRIYLKKGDTVQKYIDSISMIINGARYNENYSRKLHLKERMKHTVLKRIPPSRYYNLDISRSIQKVHPFLN
jgi:Fe-S cluster biosynthesis and repair protein YggX